MRWKTKRLGDVADFCLGKMLDARKNKGEPLPYLANINVRWGEFDLKNLREMRFEPGEMDRYGLKYGDIVMCEGGEPKRCAIWKEAIPGMMIQKALHRIRSHNGIDQRFLFYLLLHKGKTDGFTHLFTGATIKHLPKQNLAKLEIQFPELSIQTRIADILSAYDELIENNRRRIKLLEESARQLYREWFVRLRFPGHQNTRTINGLPEGWTIQSFDALYASDDAKRRFQIMAGQVFSRFKALLMEPSAMVFTERHDNIEAIYKKLQEKRDTADVTEVLKALHRIVNEAIRTTDPGTDHADGISVDLSGIDFEKLRDEFAGKVRRKHTALQDIRDVVEKKLQQMLGRNPRRMDYYKKYQEIIADYNQEKDRATVEATFAELALLAEKLDAEQRRAAKEGLTENELALFDLLFKDHISKTDRETLKQASRSLLASIVDLLVPMPDWTQKTTTRAEVEVFILDVLYDVLPRPAYSDNETEAIASLIYNHVWQQSMSGLDMLANGTRSE